MDADYTNIQEDMVINAVWTKKDNGGGNTTIIVSPSETNKYTAKHLKIVARLLRQKK